MPAFVLRVWVPDRPGALGAVASRIGAVRGDVVGIDILERGAGRAIDELVVSLPDAGLVPLLVAEVSQVDGVDVEDVHAVAEPRDTRLDALEAAAVLVAETALDGLLQTLVALTRADFDASWAAVVELTTGRTLAVAGEPPQDSWLAAFLHGSQSSAAVADGDGGPDDLAWAPLPSADLALVLGRERRPFRARERRQMAALARIADHRWCEVAARRPEVSGTA